MLESLNKKQTAIQNALDFLTDKSAFMKTPEARARKLLRGLYNPNLPERHKMNDEMQKVVAEFLSVIPDAEQLAEIENYLQLVSDKESQVRIDERRSSVKDKIGHAKLTNPSERKIFRE